MPGKVIYTGLIIMAIFLLPRCSSPVNSAGFTAVKLKGTPLFHFVQISSLDEPPLNAPEFLNRKALELLGIKKVVIYSKGGKNPEDTLEKMTFSYSDKWQKLNYRLERFDENPVLWTKGTIALSSRFTGSARFDRYFGINKKSESKFIISDNNFLIIREKRNQKNDTTVFYDSFEKPKAIVERVGKQILSVDIFVPEGSSSKVIKTAFKALELDSTMLYFAVCSVTFFDKTGPKQSYLLNDRFSQVNLLKDWKYDTGGRLTEFNEWNGNNQLKTIIIHYSASAVPDYFSINKKTYYVHYN